jgi:hypothetical protein
MGKFEWIASVCKNRKVFDSASNLDFLIFKHFIITNIIIFINIHYVMLKSKQRASESTIHLIFG